MINGLCISDKISRLWLARGVFSLPSGGRIIASKAQYSPSILFQEGVSNANTLVNPASDEINLIEKWQKLAELHRLQLHLCIAAAQRRGIVDEQTSSSATTNLAQGFTLAGLGEFSQAVLKADRLLTF